MSREADDTAQHDDAKGRAALWRRSPKVMLALAIVVDVAFVCGVLFLRGKHAALGAVGWSCVGWVGWSLRPRAMLQRVTTDAPFAPWQRVVATVVCAATIVGCIVPMSFSEVWTGEVVSYRNEYELLTEAMLEGKLSIHDEQDTTGLQALDNPYDPYQREGVDYVWDHAYYKGKYYVYFGVVPVLTVFMPYRLITGQSLASYHVTQVFSALYIVALFLLFLKILRVFRLRMPFGTWLLLCVMASVASLLCSMDTPGLYCTAVNSALAFQYWSLLLLLDAVYCREGKRSQVPVAMLGTLCGALVFGCRPTIGITNVLSVPMLIHYLKGRKINAAEVGRLCLVMLPYLLVGAGLMMYNKARFENPFDFGAAYQITLLDVGAYSKAAKGQGIPFYLDSLRQFFVSFKESPRSFPFVAWGGILCNFPILIYCLYIYQGRAIRFLRERGLLPMTVLLTILPIAGTIMTAMWSPLNYGHVVRYHMDLYPSLMLLFLLAVATSFEFEREREGAHAFLLCLAMLLTLGKCVFLFCVPYDKNWTAYVPERLDEAWDVISMGHLLG